jgi:hypothetical protein
MEKFVEVYVAADITYAYLVKAQLDNADIPARIDNENLVGGLNVDGMTPRVLVPESMAQQAREIISEMQQATAEDNDNLDEDNEEEADDASDEDAHWQ